MTTGPAIRCGAHGGGWFTKPMDMRICERSGGRLHRHVVAVREQFQATGSRSFAVEEDRITVTPSGMTDVALELAERSVVQADGRQVRGATVLASCDDPARFLADLT